MSNAYKTVRFYGSPEEINAQWLEARKNGIGGSDAAAILGLNPYSTPLTVWMEKTGNAQPADLSDNEKVYWGSVLEDVVAQEFKKRNPEFKVQRLNAMLWSRDYPWMFASVDRVLFHKEKGKGILEIKTCGERRKSDWEDGIPDYYLPQVNHYLAVTGFNYFAVAVLIGGQEYRQFYYERDDEDIAFLKIKEKQFWDCVESGTMPPALSLKKDSQALTDYFSESTDEFVEVLNADAPEVQELVRIKADIKALKEQEDTIVNGLKQRIGNHKGIITESFRITWPRSETTRFDQKRFREDNPDVYADYVIKTTRDGGLKISEVN